MFTDRHGNVHEDKKTHGKIHEDEKVVEEMICRGVKDLTIFHTENDQKKRNKTIETTGRVYFKGWKKDVPDENLFRQNNRQFVKLLESAALTWFGLTKPLIVKN